MVPVTPPTAEGDLTQTPYAHLAVYSLDRRLTGELFLRESEDITHVVRFERGVPVKIKMGDNFARLGELLVEDGLVTADVIESAVLTGGLLGDILILSDRLETAALNQALERQFRYRMDRMFELPAQTSYAYYEGSETLKEWGGEPANYDPLALIWAGVRSHGENSAFFEATLDRLAGVALKVHPQACLSRFEFEEDAALLAEVLALEPTPMSELLDIEGIAPDIVNKFIYAMAICRQLDLGRGTLPVGLEQKSSSLAKVQLRSQVHRVGVAVDAPIDGERSRRKLSIRGRAIIPRDDDAPPESIPPKPLSIPAPESIPETKPSAADPVAAPREAAASEDAPVSSGPVTEATGAPAALEPASGAMPVGDTLNSATDDLEDPPAEGSTKRFLAETIRGLPAPALAKLAREKIDERESELAVEVAAIGIKKLTEEGQAESDEGFEMVALHVWARSLAPHPDLKTLAVELDDLIRQRDSSTLPRLVRGMLRKRLGNEAGSSSDFRRVLEIEPNHELARAGLQNEPRSVRRGETGFLKRLLRR